MSKSEKVKKQEFSSYISSSLSLPEMTFKAVFLGILMAILFAASTCYLGLKVGRTIAASVPAAVLSMAILRCFRRSNILENNVVQTISSAGEVIAAGGIFTLPALILMGWTTHFNFWETFVVMGAGGVLGVLFSVPLRRCMIVEQALPYPEGVVAGEVLKAGDASSFRQIRDLVLGGSFAIVTTFLQTGFKLVSESVQLFTFRGGTVWGIGFGFSPILIAAGRIIGLQGALGIMVGCLLMWCVTMPAYIFFDGAPPEAMQDPFSHVMSIYSGKTRYIGIGCMLTGGLWSMVSILPSIRAAVISSWQAVTHRKKNIKITRTDYDIPMVYVILGTLCVAPFLFLFFERLFGSFGWAPYGVSSSLLALGATLFCFFVGFFSASIGSYMTGIVGSSSMPASGITIFSVVLFALFLISVLGCCSEHLDVGQGGFVLQAATATVMVAAVVCTAASVGGDNLQDLKVGHIVGATPWKQELCLVIGAIVSALLIAPLLNTLFQAYGMGNILPHNNMDASKSLAAPQAMMMATVAQGVLAKNLEWPMMILGGGIGVIGIFFDEKLRRSKSLYRVPVLSLALGMYLPSFYSLPIVFGAVMGYGFDRYLRYVQEKRRVQNLGEREMLERRSILVSSGVIAGESIIGIILAIPFAIYQCDDVFALDIPALVPWADALGYAIILAMTFLFYHLMRQSKQSISPR